MVPKRSLRTFRHFFLIEDGAETFIKNVSAFFLIDGAETFIKNVSAFFFNRWCRNVHKERFGVFF